MRTRKPFELFVLLLSLASCSNITEEFLEDKCVDEGIRFVATSEMASQTRTVRRQDGAVWWNPSESIRVFYGLTSSKFKSTNTEPAATATFSGSLGGYDYSSEDVFCAVFPYCDEDHYDGQHLTVEIPSRQEAVAGSFDRNSFVSIARSRDFQLKFKHVCGGVKFKLSKSGVVKVTFKGNRSETLAGTVKLGFGEDAVPYVSENIHRFSELSLSASEGNTLIPGEWYHIVSLPARLSEGYTMTLIYADNHREVVKSDHPVEIDRCVFGTVSNANEKVTETQEPAGGTASGLYVGIIGFNTDLYYYPIGILKAKTLGGYYDFIDRLPQEHVTLLYYSVKESIRSLQVANYPDNLSSASIVSFTDGRDDGSVFFEQYPGSSDNYLDEVHDRLYEEEVSGLPLSAWTIGLLSKDASYNTLFEQDLQKLSRPATNGITISDMAELNGSFEQIAGELNQSFNVYSIQFRIAGKANGDRIRFTLDNANSINASSQYIEGVFDMNSISLYEVSYHGIKCSSGATVKGVRSGNMVTFRFEGIRTENNTMIDKSRFMEWEWRDAAQAWLPSSEFDPEKDSAVENVKQSAVVLLNLDCTTSLSSGNSNLFPELKSAAKAFLARLCSLAADPLKVATVSLSKNFLTLKAGEGATLVPTVLPATALDKSVIWSSSDPSIATVSTSGYVRAIAPGKATITVTTRDEECTANCEVTVNPVPVSSVTLDRTELTLNRNTTYSFRATVNPSNATYKTVYWTSSESSVASVDDQGVVRGLKAGTATITANASGKTASCLVTVVVPVETVQFGIPTIFPSVGDNVKICPYIQPYDATTLTLEWSSSNPSVAYPLSQYGEFNIIICVAPGTAIIAANSLDGSGAHDQFEVSIREKGQTSLGESFEAVDMGLSVKWASFNLGATKPEENGDGYSWGETATKGLYNWSTYSWCYGNSRSINKYAVGRLCESLDYKMTLEPLDDAAYVLLGGKWRIPNLGEWLELKKNCTWRYFQLNGITVSEGTSRINGNKIYFPTTYRYSTSSLVPKDAYSSSSFDARFLDPYPTFTDYSERSGFFVIRPVLGATIPVENVSLDRSEVKLHVGEYYYLSAILSPANTTYNIVSWRIDDSSIASVEQSYESSRECQIIAKKEGTTMLYAMIEGGKTVSCRVTVIPGSVVYEDDFEWLAPWTASNVGDDVSLNFVNIDTAPNIFTVPELSSCLDEFRNRGYGYIWGWKDQPWSNGNPDMAEKRTMYLQRNYLKFGKTGCNSGIILPPLSSLNGTARIRLTFDWCSCMTGKLKPDLTSLQVEVSGNAFCVDTDKSVSREITTSQPINEDGTTILEWQRATVYIYQASPDTRITIRPANYDPDITNFERHQNRWYLDNIKVEIVNS